MIMIQAFAGWSCRRTTESTVDDSLDDWGWSQGDWALVQGFNLSYQNKEPILFTIDPNYGNLN